MSARRHVSSRQLSLRSGELSGHDRSNGLSGKNLPLPADWPDIRVGGMQVLPNPAALITTRAVSAGVVDSTRPTGGPAGSVARRTAHDRGDDDRCWDPGSREGY
jgi:hypothetical protein